MPISIRCTGCGKSYAVKDELAGKRARCAACGAAIPIPPASPPLASHAKAAGAAAVSSQPQQSSGDVLKASNEPLPSLNASRVAKAGVPPPPAEFGLVLLPRRSKGLTVMAVWNCLIGIFWIFCHVYSIVTGATREVPWLLLVPDFVLSVLLVVSGVGYYLQKEALGWRVGNAYGCLGVLRYFLLVKLAGWYSCLWFSLWLIYPVLTLALLNSVFRTQFPGPAAGRKPIVPAHWGLWRRAQILLAGGLLVYLIVPRGAVMPNAGRWYSGSSPQSESAEEPPVNPFDFMGRTALHTAASQGLLDEVRELLDKGADVNARSRWEGCTPLHVAAEANCFRVAELLLARKAEVNVKDDFGRTPLHSVAKGGNVDLARLLLERGADVNATAGTGGDTPMHTASAAGQEPIVLLLLSKGANVNAKNQLGTTPLDYAERNPSMMSLLRQNGAKPGRPAL